ncbi:MAG: RibD family protein [Deltaproteobacteria bacterium]|nr:RibD family protein [Deltaproteobacteria bacterium]
MRPRVTLHFAQSLDGKIDDPSAPRSVRLSNEAGFVAAHRARAENDAVLVGITTVLRDDPKLNVRRLPGKNPHRVVLDSSLRTPETALLFDGSRKEARVIIIASERVRTSPVRATLEARGAEILFCPEDAHGRPQLLPALARLHDTGIASLLVEGGRSVLSAFMIARAVDVLQTELCMTWIGDDGLSTFEPLVARSFELQDVTATALGENLLIRGRPHFVPALASAMTASASAQPPGP